MCCKPADTWESCRNLGFPCAFCRRKKPSSRWMGSSLLDLKRGCGYGWDENHQLPNAQLLPPLMCGDGDSGISRAKSKWSDWPPVIWERRYHFSSWRGSELLPAPPHGVETAGSSLGALPQMRSCADPTPEISGVPIRLRCVLQRALLRSSESALGTAASEMAQPQNLWSGHSPAKQEICFTESY